MRCANGQGLSAKTYRVRASRSSLRSLSLSFTTQFDESLKVSESRETAEDTELGSDALTLIKANSLPSVRMWGFQDDLVRGDHAHTFRGIHGRRSHCCIHSLRAPPLVWLALDRRDHADARRHRAS